MIVITGHYFLFLGRKIHYKSPSIYFSLFMFRQVSILLQHLVILSSPIASAGPYQIFTSISSVRYTAVFKFLHSIILMASLNTLYTILNFIGSCKIFTAISSSSSSFFSFFFFVFFSSSSSSFSSSSSSS